jgi:hypothetical protein
MSKKNESIQEQAWEMVGGVVFDEDGQVRNHIFIPITLCLELNGSMTVCSLYERNPSIMTCLIYIIQTRAGLKSNKKQDKKNLDFFSFKKQNGRQKWLNGRLKNSKNIIINEKF